MRVIQHPILGELKHRKTVTITVDGEPVCAFEGEPIAAALMANGIIVHRFTSKKSYPRGVFCGIGRCTDCVMVVDGVPNVRTCVTPVRDGMRIETQKGRGDVRKS